MATFKTQCKSCGSDNFVGQYSAGRKEIPCSSCGGNLLETPKRSAGVQILPVGKANKPLETPNKKEDKAA